MRQFGKPRACHEVPPVTGERCVGGGWASPLKFVVADASAERSCCVERIIMEASASDWQPRNANTASARILVTFMRWYLPIVRRAPEANLVERRQLFDLYSTASYGVGDGDGDGSGVVSNCL